jgi:hypothetical protein
VVADVEDSGSLTPLLDKLLFDLDLTQSSPSRQSFHDLPASPSSSSRRRPEDTGSITQASIRRLWEEGNQR